MKTRFTWGSLDGFEGLEANLKALPTRVENRVLQGAVIEALKPTRDRIRKAAPKSRDGDRSPSSKLYGRLSQNIRIMRLKKVNKGQKGARIHTGRAFWGMMLELGTRYIAAKPWFSPVFRQDVDAIIGRLGRALGAGIEREAKR